VTGTEESDVASIVAVPSIGWPELLLVLAVLLLLFGARKLPDMARSLGRSTKEFKAGMKDGVADQPDEAGDAPEKTPRS
jgi:sec-independent protein translocase protein TatA